MGDPKEAMFNTYLLPRVAVDRAYYVRAKVSLAAGSVLMSNEKTIRVNLVGNIARKGFVVYDALLFSLAIGCISKDEGNWVSIGCGKCLFH